MPNIEFQFYIKALLGANPAKNLVDILTSLSKSKISSRDGFRELCPRQNLCTRCFELFTAPKL